MNETKRPPGELPGGLRSVLQHALVAYSPGQSPRTVPLGPALKPLIVELVLTFLKSIAASFVSNGGYVMEAARPVNRVFTVHWRKRELEKSMHDEDSEHILKRREQLRSRSLSRWRKLLVAGAATGVAFGTMTCRAQVCLSQVMPLECTQEGANYQLQYLVQLDARWVESTPGTFEVSLTAHIDLTGMVVEDPLTFRGSPSLVDAVLLEDNVTDHDLTLSCEPGGGTASIEVLLPMDCGSYAEAVHILLDVSATPADGQTIPVTWLE